MVRKCGTVQCKNLLYTRNQWLKPIELELKPIMNDIFDKRWGSSETLLAVSGELMIKKSAK